MTVILTQAAEGLPRRRFTVDDLRAMLRAGVLGKDERVELIGGELVPMAPKSLRHGLIKTRLNRHWFHHAPPDISFSTEATFSLGDDTYVEPDFVFYRAGDELDGLTAETVLLVVEVADTSLEYDTGRKADLYAVHGVRELWVVDAVEPRAWMYRDAGPNGYEWVEEVHERPVNLPFLSSR